MTSSIILGVRIVPNQYSRIKLENVDLECKVDKLKEEAVSKIKVVQKQGIELIYCGNILEDEATLSACGIKPGVTIHVLKKVEPVEPTPTSRTFTEADVQQLIVAFRSFFTSYRFRIALQKLSRPEVLENMIATTPGLSDDPVAIALIQDPDLLVHLSDPNTVRSVVKHHPSLVDAANQIAAVIHEEAVNVNPNAPGPSSGISYMDSLMSDDEEMDSSSSDGAQGQPLSRNQSYSAITTAQLAAAIANVTGSSFAPSTPTSSGGAFTPSSTPNSSSLITNEMFTQAMRQAFANVTTPTASTENNGESLESIMARLRPQLQQMHEIGLSNDVINVQALQATNGDVQAAIDLVFSGAISPD